MIWWIPLMTAAAGALMDKKKPLRGAMIGGAAGFGGAGLLGAGAAGGAAAGGASSGAAGTASMSGLLGQAGQAAGAAQTVAGMLPQGDQPPMAQPLQQRPGPDDSGFLAAQSQQQQATEEQKRMRKMLEQAYVQRLMGGGNGLA